MKPPPIHYADTPDGKVAYQVVGEGPIDLVLTPFPGRHNLDVIWEHPQVERYLRRLASFSRLILLNFRGTGISDPVDPRNPPTPEAWAHDVKHVLDAVGSTQTAIFTHEVGGASTMFFAATYPERVRALVMLNCLATFHRDDDYPWGFRPDQMEYFFQAFVKQWGTGENLDFMSPELAKDERFRDWFARLERLTMSPTMIAATSDVNTGDVRGILHLIKAPTLVISHSGVPWVRLGHGRYLADHIADARYVERQGTWGVYWHDDVDWTLDEVQNFLTGTRAEPSVDDRVLATVLYTDVVGSTSKLAEVGDARWREILDAHDAVVRTEIERFRGNVVTTTGDGVLATFDGPARAIRCAVALRDSVKPLGLSIRTGLHTGEVEMRGADVSGIAVHIGARVMSEAATDEILVSGSIPPLVAGSGIEFTDRGERELKGVPGSWRLYSV